MNRVVSFDAVDCPQLFGRREKDPSLLQRRRVRPQRDGIQRDDGAAFASESPRGGDEEASRLLLRRGSIGERCTQNTTSVEMPIRK